VVLGTSSLGLKIIEGNYLAHRKIFRARLLVLEKRKQLPVKKVDLSGCRSSRTADIFWFPFAVAPERVRVHSRCPGFRHQSQPVTARAVFTPTPTFLPQSQGAIR
jgi:hypothetical protein